MIKLTTCMTIAGTTSAMATTIFFEPSLYFSELDSPFYGGIVDNTGERIFLEDFEDQALNTPNVRSPDSLREFGTTFRARFPDPPADGVVWSVDGDDGSVDMAPNFGGDVWTSISRVTNGPAEFMEFEFLPDDQGRLPRYVGLVITRVLDVNRDVEVQWRDTDGRTLFPDGEFNPKDWSPPGGAGPGDPQLMRFVGLFHSEGIQRIQLANVRQIDHLQYGFAIPEPSTSLLIVLSCSFIFCFRKRP